MAMLVWQDANSKRNEQERNKCMLEMDHPNRSRLVTDFCLASRDTRLYVGKYDGN